MSRKRKVTLTDVARSAGVSSTTASYILNGRSAEMRIAPETERRVREAASALDYRPNRNARNLRTSSTATIGVISDFVASGHFASELLAGAGRAARGGGHLLVIGETEGDSEVERQLIEEMIDRRVEGIIYVRLVTQEVSVPPLLVAQRPVLLNCVDPRTSLPAVLPDELQGGRTAAEVVVTAGVARRVVVVGEDRSPGALAGRQRLAGLQARLAEAGQAVAEVVPCDWRVHEAYEAVDRWLAGRGRATVFVCLNDRVAMGTYQALATHGLRVPDDVGVVSFDGSELASWLRPTLSSITIPYAALGARAVERLLSPGDTDDQVLRLPMELAAGDSVVGVDRHRASTPVSAALRRHGKRVG